MANPAPIGLLDSGVGGISVLKALQAGLPKEHFILFGDAGHAPYGTKEVDEVKRLVLNASRQLMRHGIKALVLACNTATALALDEVRALLPIPVIGIMPPIDEALQLRKSGQVLVLATPNTLRSSAFAGLIRGRDHAVTPVPCPGLMEFVERGELSGTRLEQKLNDLLRAHMGRPIDAVVLGCTHFPFLKAQIQTALAADAPFLTGSRQTLDALKAALRDADAFAPDYQTGAVKLLTSGCQNNVLQMSTLLHAPI